MSFQRPRVTPPPSSRKRTMMLLHCLQKCGGDGLADPLNPRLCRPLWSTRGKGFYVAAFEPSLCLWLLDSRRSDCVSLQIASTGICLGAGLQAIVACTNIVCYYVISLSVGAALMFVAELSLLGNVISNNLLRDVSLLMQEWKKRDPSHQRAWPLCAHHSERHAQRLQLLRCLMPV